MRWSVVYTTLQRMHKQTGGLHSDQKHAVMEVVTYLLLATFDCELGTFFASSSAMMWTGGLSQAEGT